MAATPMVFDLTDENFVRKDTERVKLKGANANVEYMLHHEELQNPDDPVGTPFSMWCVYVPQIKTSYVDRSEELVFEALHEFFQEDFIRFFADRLLEERERHNK